MDAKSDVKTWQVLNTQDLTQALLYPGIQARLLQRASGKTILPMYHTTAT